MVPVNYPCALYSVGMGGYSSEGCLPPPFSALLCFSTALHCTALLLYCSASPLSGTLHTLRSAELFHFDRRVPGGQYRVSIEWCGLTQGIPRYTEVYPVYMLWLVCVAQEYWWCSVIIPEPLTALTPLCVCVYTPPRGGETRNYYSNRWSYDHTVPTNMSVLNDNDARHYTAHTGTEDSLWKIR